MAFTRTMGQLVGMCKRRADKENDGQIGQTFSTEWQEMISELYGDLHAAVSQTGARYFETEADITATGAASYALPSAHMATVGVDYVLDAAGRRRELGELMVQERGYFAGQTGAACMWAFTGTNIALYPKPSSGTYKHIYVPQPTDYSAAGDGTAIDLINNDGLKFVVWGVTSIAMHKGDADQQRAMFERDAARERLVEWAVLRALTMPKRRVVRETDLGDLAYSPAAWWRQWGVA